jgi:flavin-dependent dehydrogenase
MAGIEDRHRNLMIDGSPVATGVVALGDALACSNPTVGKGASIGMLQAVLLRDTIAAAGLEDPWEFASVAMALSRAADVMARPGLRDKVSTLGAGWRDEPLPAPSRAELLSIVAGD